MPRYVAQSLIIAALVFFGAAPGMAMPPPTEAMIESMSPLQLLDKIETGQEYPASQQVELAQLAMQKVLDTGQMELKPRAALSLALALYADAQHAETLELIEECLQNPQAIADPSIVLRLQALRAGLWLLNGELERSVKEYERLINLPDSSADEIGMLRLRSNYALALEETGQAFAAIEEIQSVIVTGLKLDLDFLVLGNANNLIVLLEEQHLYNDAMEWLDRVRPIMETSGAHYYVESLEVQEMQLLIRSNQPQEAKRQLREFVKRGSVSSPLIEGHAHIFLSQALLATGDLQEAQAAAETAMSLLVNVPLEALDAKFVLVETLIKQGKLNEAQRYLQEISTSPALPPLNQENLLRQELEIGLARSNEPDLLKKYETLQRQKEIRERAAVEQASRYFDVKAEASENAALAESARQQQLFTLVIAVMTAGFVLLVSLSLVQRRFTRKLGEQQRELNRQLTAQVDEKTQALKNQLDEQAELERVVAEKAHAEALGQLTGNVAHDFNNLLQVILIANENLMGLKKDDFQKSLLDGSNQALNDAKTIIRQLLSYARQQELAEETLCISSYLKNTQTLFNAAIDGTVNFTIDDQSNNAHVNVDRSQLTTALLNLFTNSCDAMPDGGQLTLTVTTNNSGDEMSTESGSIELHIKDTGIGMTAAHLEKAADPFYTTKSDEHGTGLGLSSVQGFVKQSGGEMEITSELAKGTLVSLKFPVVQKSTVKLVTDRQQRVDLEDINIMLVEDNPILASTLERMIERLGATVEHLPNGDDAAKRLQHSNNFDLVLSDIRMPGRKDGFALADWIRSNYPQLPVLLMSGYSDSVDGGEPVMSKPFTQANLLAHVQRTVAR